jgi:hypothetical protein
LRNLIVALGVFGSFGLAGNAMAKWGHEGHDRGGSPPPGTFRPEITLRGASDGRADLHSDRASASDRYAQPAAKPLPDRDYGQMKHGSPVPMKTEIALRKQGGDNREGAASQGKQAVAEQRNAPDNRFGRAHKPPPVSLKTEITLRMQHGDNREGGASKSAVAKPAGSSDAQKRGERTGLAKPLSYDQKVTLCRQTGVCLPLLLSTDNSDDKSE